MQYTMHDEPEYWGESIRALIRLYNNNPISDIKKKFLEKNGAELKDELSPLLDALDRLLADIGDQLDLADPRAALLLRTRNATDELIHSVYIRHRSGGKETRPYRDAIAYAIDSDCLEETFHNTGQDLEDDRTFFQWLDARNIPSEDKYDAYKLCTCFAEYEEYALHMIGKVTELIREGLSAVKPLIRSGLEQFVQVMEQKDFSFLGDPPVFRLDNEEHHKIYPSLFEPNSIKMLYYEKPWIRDLLVGVSFFSLKKLTSVKGRRREQLNEFLKALADPTKLTILQKLKEKPYYSGELAAELGLTGPTISHHMNTLTNLYVITLEKSGNRIYYGLNHSSIRSYLEDVQSMFSEE